MPRSSFADNPLLRVSRPVSACSRCRAAKVKCDGKLPACTACEKAGREGECSAANDQFARGKERSYVAALELRVEKLERRLAYARSRKASVAMHDPDSRLASDAERKDSLATIRAAIHRKAARKRENSDVNSLVSDFGYLSVNATTRDFEPSVSNMTFARLVLAAATNDPLPEPQNRKLPSKQAAQVIVQYYLTNIYPLFPAFSETTLMSTLDSFYQQEKPQIKSADYWLLYLVLAIGSTAQSRWSQDDHYNNGVDFATRALHYADKALTPGYATQIQSLLLLTQYAMLDPAHFDSWHLIGFACRAVLDLGYHQDPPHSQSLDKSVLDARQRVFYCAYALDRSISMVHARPFSFTDDSADVTFPSPTPPARSPSIITSPTVSSPPTDPALLHFRLRRAQSHWYQTLFQSDPNDLIPDATSFIWQMCQDMREWEESLPSTLPIGIRELFDLELRYSYVYCVAPSARAPHLTAYGRMLIFEHAIAYLERIHAVANAPMNTAFYTYHDALKVYFMGSQFVAVLRDAGDALLSGSIAPVPVTMPGKASPPPMPRPPSGRLGGAPDNLDRSLRTLEGVSLTLERYGERWEDAFALKQSFEGMSAEVRDWLQTRLQMRNSASPQPGRQGYQQVAGAQQGGPRGPQQQQQQQQPQPQQHHQQQQSGVQWAGVDMVQMMQGGNGYDL